MVNCVVAGCTKRTGDNVSFFRFPKVGTEEYKSSIIRVNRVTGNPASEKLWEPYPTSVVCSDHFTDESFTRRPSVLKSIGFSDFKRLRLVQGAVPSVFPQKTKDDARSDRLKIVLPKEPRPAFAKRERQRVLADALIEYTCSRETTQTGDETTADSGEETEFEITSTDHEIAKKLRHTGCQTSRMKLYVKGVQTEIKNTTQGIQTDKVICVSVSDLVHVGVMTDQSETYVQQKASLPTAIHCPTCTCNCSSALPSEPPYSESLKKMEELLSDEDDESDEEPDDEWMPNEYEDDIISDEDNETNETLDITDVEYDDHIGERKYIVFESALKELLSVCHLCTQPCQVIITKQMGSLVSFSMTCTQGHTFLWENQPMHKRLPLGNLFLSGAILFSGSGVNNVLNVFKRSNIACMSDRNFRSIQASYLIPSVENVWKDSVRQNIDDLQRRTVKGMPDIALQDILLSIPVTQ